MNYLRQNLSLFFLVFCVLLQISCTSSPTHELNVELRVQMEHLLTELSTVPEDPIFTNVLSQALEEAQQSKKPLLPTFLNQLQQSKPDLMLGMMFANEDLQIGVSSPEKEVVEILRRQAQTCMQYSVDVLLRRLELMTGYQPEIEVSGDYITIQVKGSENTLAEWQRLFKKGEFAIAEAHPLSSSIPILLSINEKLWEEGVTFKEYVPEEPEDPVSFLESVAKDSSIIDTVMQNFMNRNPLFTVLMGFNYEELIRMGQESPRVGVVHEDSLHDKFLIDSLLQDPSIQALIPENMEFLWTPFPKEYMWGEGQPKFWELIGIRKGYDGEYAMEWIDIESARDDFDMRKEPVVVIHMGEEDTREWARLTESNVGRYLAILIDEEVYSYPIVNEGITQGVTQISNSFSVLEAKHFAILVEVPLPVSVEIVRGKSMKLE